MHARRIRLQAFPAATVAAVTLCVAIVGLAPGTAPARASTNEQAIFGGGSELLADPAATLDELRLVGVQTVRVFVQWSAIAPGTASRTEPRSLHPADPRSYPAAAWAPYDAFVRAAQARGINVMFDVTGPAPLWAAGIAPGGTASHNAATWEPSAVQFGRFVQAIATRYDGEYDPATGAAAPGNPDDLPRVSEWSVWNEPNFGPDLTPQVTRGAEIAARSYRALLGQAWNALQRTGHGRDTILFGELAPHGSRVPAVANGTDPLRFLRALYCVQPSGWALRGAAAAARGCPTTATGVRRFAAENPALFRASGFAIHPYTAGETGPPNASSPRTDPDWTGFADLPRLTRTLDLLTRAYGSTRRLPIYDTEFGFQTSPPKQNCTCTSPATAAYYMNWVEYLSYTNARLQSYAQYQLDDLPLSAQITGVYTAWASGLVSPTGTPWPTFDAYRLPLYLPVTRTYSGQSLLVWGDVRPAAFARADAGAAQTVQVQFSMSGTGAGTWTTLRTVTVTSPRGYFQTRVVFPSTGLVRLRYTYPSAFGFVPSGGIAGTVASRTVSVQVR